MKVRLRSVRKPREESGVKFHDSTIDVPRPNSAVGGGGGGEEEEVLKCNAAVVKPAIAEQPAKGWGYNRPSPVNIPALIALHVSESTDSFCPAHDAHK